MKAGFKDEMCNIRQVSSRHSIHNNLSSLSTASHCYKLGTLKNDNNNNLSE